MSLQITSLAAVPIGSVKYCDKHDACLSTHVSKTTQTTRMFRRLHRVAAPAAKSVVSDFMCENCCLWWFAAAVERLLLRIDHNETMASDIEEVFSHMQMPQRQCEVRQQMAPAPASYLDLQLRQPRHDACNVTSFTYRIIIRIFCLTTLEPSDVCYQST